MPDHVERTARYTLRRVEAHELRLVGSVDRSEELGHEYVCIPTPDGLGLVLVRRAVRPARLISTWSPGELESRLSAWGQKLRAGAVLVGSFQQEILAGFVLFVIHTGQQRGEIDSLCVDVCHRRRGLGAALLGHAEAHCREHGCRTLLLSTGRSAPAVDFYLRRGFRIVGIVEPEYAARGIELTLAKDLSTSLSAPVASAPRPEG